MKSTILTTYLPGLPVILCLATAGFAAADFDPIPLTPGSYNADVIVEKTAPRPFAIGTSTTVSMDGGTANTGFTWYEQGFNTANTGSGLPPAGDSFTHASDATKSYAMPPTYVGSCTVFLSSQVTTGSLMLTTPAAFTNLSFLSSSGGGSANINYKITFTDASTETGSFTSGDWFNGANPAWTAKGRVNPGTGAFDNVGLTNPRLYSQDITVVSTQLVSKVDFTFVSGGRCSLFAITGKAGGIWSTQSVTGFNHDAVVGFGEVSLTALTTATNVSMDGGTANTGNTWYERGYYPQAPNSGLPAQGSVITSTSQADRHYLMPANYAAPNAIYVDAANPVKTITLANPLNYSALSFLNATANGAVTVECTMHYQDSSSEVKTFVAKDWFNGSPFAYNSAGRVNLGNRTLNNVNGTNPRLYEEQFLLGNTVSPIVSVDMKWLSGGATSRVVVLAVSATAGAIAPSYATLPAPVSLYSGSPATFTATIGGGSTPITYRWQKNVGGTFVNLSDGGNISGSTTLSLSINPATSADESEYRLRSTNIAGTNPTPPVALTVLSELPDVTTPGDPISAVGGTTPAGEEVLHVIDNVGQKYLNFGSGPNANANPFVGPVGFIVTPSIGATIVSGIRIYTANDTVGRDPVDIALEGSNDGGASWAPIVTSPLALPDGRNAGGAIALDPLTQFLRQVLFPNPSSYFSYRVTFTNVKDAAGVNSMQVAEVELLGTLAPVEISISPAAGGQYEVHSNILGNLQTSLDLIPWSNIGPISPTLPYLFTPDPGDNRRFFRIQP